MTKNKLVRMLALIVVASTLAMLAGCGFAGEFEGEDSNGEIVDSNISGEVVRDGDYYFDEKSGTLTIFGNGDMEQYYYDYDIKEVNSPWYCYRDSVKTVIIEEGVTSITSWAFYYFNALTNIEIPDSVTCVSGGPFATCKNLNYNDIAGVKYLGNKNNPYLVLVDVDERVDSIAWGENVNVIADLAFSFCDQLTSVKIPNSVTDIGEHAFYFCKRITSIEIPDSVISIGNSPFFSCYNLTDINYWGTIDQWNNIKNIENIDVYSNCTIHCTDGDIVIE